MIYAIVILLIIIAGIANAITDILRNNFKESIFKNLNPQYWNGEISWMNKWVDGDKTKGRTFWLIPIRLGKRKLFEVKMTIPVVFTDAWHLFKTIMLTAFAIAFGLLTPHFLGFPIFCGCWYLGFELFYSKFLRG